MLLCLQIRIWARRSAIAQGQGDYALSVTGPVLDFLQSYYNISYPLSKSGPSALITYHHVSSCLSETPDMIHVPAPGPSRPVWDSRSVTLLSASQIKSLYPTFTLERWRTGVWWRTEKPIFSTTVWPRPSETRRPLPPSSLTNWHTWWAGPLLLFLCCLVCPLVQSVISELSAAVVWKPGDSALVERGVAERGLRLLRVLPGSRSRRARLEPGQSSGPSPTSHQRLITW